MIFLHGLPESWYQWHHEMAEISRTHYCIAVDLKGYGQSDKRPGDYRHEGVAEQLLALLDTIGLHESNLANHPDRVLRYARGEQHLYHFNPRLAPQEKVMMDAPRSRVMEDPARFVLGLYKQAAARPIPDADIQRAIQEFSYPGIPEAVPRYFHSSSFRKEWIDRRTRLLEAWRCPVMIIQGYETLAQPRELYEDAPSYIPNAKEVLVRFIDSGHFWLLENPEQTTEAVLELLSR